MSDGICDVRATKRSSGPRTPADRRNGLVRPRRRSEWGIEIAGGAAPRILQPKPARLEVFRTEEDIRQLAAGYKTVQKSAAGIDARAEIAYGDNVVFRVQDRWSLTGAVVSVRRKVEVTGNAPGGFDSSVVLHG